MKYLYLMFDLDHTLLDFDRAEDFALDQVLLHQGLSPEELLTYKAYYVPMNQALWKDLEKGLISRQDLVDSRFQLLFQHFGQEVDGKALAYQYQQALGLQGHIYPGADKLLQQLTNKGYRIYAISNGLSAIQHPRLVRSGLNQFFEQVFISQEVGAVKPDTAFFNRVAQQIKGFDSSQALIIGDSLSADIQGGFNIGWDTLWLQLKGLSLSRPAQATYQMSSYQEILNLLVYSL